MNQNSEQTLPIRANMDIIRRLQEQVAPETFTPRCVYDGRKNLFSIRQLPFSDGKQTFDVAMGEPPSPGGTAHRERKPIKVTLTEVAQINPEVLQRFLKGQQSHDNEVLTAITALNVVVRMEPTANYPFNIRSFFTPQETRDIGNGIVLWRGYFQSVRPAVGRMLINIDISTGMMYKPGSLIDLCLDFFGFPGRKPVDINRLSPSSGLPERERLRLQRFITGVKVTTTLATGQGRSPRAVKKLSTSGARKLSFALREGDSITVADYFQKTYNLRLSYPDLLCVEVGNGALIPLELCLVPPGQIMRKQIPAEKTKSVVEFATRRPEERLRSIRDGLGVLAYGQSEYVRQFGLHVHEAEGPLQVDARILQPPTLQYGRGSSRPTIIPRDGSWNMVDKKFYKAASIEKFAVVIFEREQRFGQAQAREMTKSLVEACTQVGIQVLNKVPVVKWASTQSTIHDTLHAAGKECFDLAEPKKKPPTLIVVVLPENATDVYTAVKHFGDVARGVATQCMKSMKCSRANPQYFANVCLKINVKLGGINTIPEGRSVPILTDPHNPTMVMGADVIHPAAHSEGRPSFTSLVASIDSDTALYAADCRVQASRQEMIEDLEEMSKLMITKYKNYRKTVEKKTNLDPKRIIFFRDGVSEGQFKQVLEIELPRIKKACVAMGIPKVAITVIVVGKRHHVRFFPVNPQNLNEADRKSGNCKAGTVVDRDIVHPVELDFYLQSHAGLLGTSRPAHYNVLYDDNNFTADALQALCFALCHVYARSTRSVSIPAPVYYADIVCSRAKNHYDPTQNLDLSDSNSVTGTDAEKQVQTFRDAFIPLHRNLGQTMYFS
ncbi:hypothetical protein PHLGIDRAFT_125407 [Phlebiopsis gigantea 11061_1 CR5-6]|uniref:Piwi domain-containing protein n=1 Tax=Phlebiopsis gigantea (strain 11061_1 CR5-6) TaxID=745531 RepID=A0A0C3SC96_PHLG1|nr:hypothetical protein PHLGIDRAFT_125407 [Phlebiopsis gigantea 11061_1 CR5-6]